MFSYSEPMNSNVLGCETMEKIGPESPRIDFSSKNAIFRFPVGNIVQGYFWTPTPKKSPGTSPHVWMYKARCASLYLEGMNAATASWEQSHSSMFARGMALR